MGELAIKHLVAKECIKMIVVNRSEERVATRSLREISSLRRMFLGVY